MNLKDNVKEIIVNCPDGIIERQTFLLEILMKVHKQALQCKEVRKLLLILKTGLSQMQKINGDDSKCSYSEIENYPNHAWIHQAEEALSQWEKAVGENK